MQHIGLDFGTSTTLFSNSQGVFQPFGIDEFVIPSVAGFHEETQEWLFGSEAAKRIPPSKLVRSMKVAISHELENLSTVDGLDTFPADEIIVGFLQSLKKLLRRDQDYRDLDIRMSCPALWNKRQRLRLLQCAKKAGVSVAQGVLLDEPVAAAIGWIENLPYGERPNGRVLVFDMGGGTLDLAVVDVDNESGKYQVRSTWGSNFAGNAFDEQLAEYLIDKFDIAELRTGSSVRTDIAWFRQWCKGLKERLTIESEVSEDLLLPRSERTYLVSIDAEELKLQLSIFFEEHVWTQIRQTLKLLQTNILPAAERETLDQIGRLSWHALLESVDSVLLAGGMCKVPALSELLIQGDADQIGFSGKEFHPRVNVNREELVARGLGQIADFENININRPDFDLYLEWIDKSSSKKTSIILWEAYSEIVNTRGYDFRNPAGFIAFDQAISVSEQSKPHNWTGQIIARSITGEPLAFDAGHKSGYFIPYEFWPNGRSGHFRLYPDGYFHIRKEKGDVIKGQMTSWPKARISLEPQSWPREELSWYNKPSN